MVIYNSVSQGLELPKQSASLSRLAKEGDRELGDLSASCPVQPFFWVSQGDGHERWQPNVRVAVPCAFGVEPRYMPWDSRCLGSRDAKEHEIEYDVKQGPIGSNLHAASQLR